MININFMKCDKTKRTTCKSDTVVKEWLKTHNLILVYNRQELNLDEYFDQTFLKGSYMERVPININDQQLMPFTVTAAALETKDTFWPANK